MENKMSPAENAPNKTVPPKTTNVGGKVEWDKTEGGTVRDPEDKKEARKDGVVTVVDEKDGVKTFRSAVNQEELDKTKPAETDAPQVPFNHTLALTGVPGNVNLTQGGMLAGDKSVRADRSLEEINKEMEEKAGPNPSPNREGNEILKATTIGPNQVVSYDLQTNGYADKLAGLSEKSSLTEDDKKELKAMADNLRSIGKV